MGKKPNPFPRNHWTHDAEKHCSAGTDASGTSLLGLYQAAQTLGFDARGATGDYESLRSVQLPCIAHVVVEGGPHYVVVYEAGEHELRVADPA